MAIMQPVWRSYLAISLVIINMLSSIYARDYYCPDQTTTTTTTNSIPDCVGSSSHISILQWEFFVQPGSSFVRVARFPPRV